LIAMNRHQASGRFFVKKLRKKLLHLRPARFFSKKEALACLLALLPLSAHCAVTIEDVQVAARVLAFTATPLSGTVKLGLVYDPGIAGSKDDEQALLRILGNGLTVGSVKLVPVLVPIERLSSAKVDVLFLTSGLGAGASQVAQAAAARKLMCITTDLAATQAGNCAVRVQSDPQVQITINMAEAAASGVSFGTAFMMMVNQI
jgi:hypothetical protein